MLLTCSIQISFFLAQKGFNLHSTFINYASLVFNFLKASMFIAVSNYIIQIQISINFIFRQKGFDFHCSGNPGPGRWCPCSSIRSWSPPILHTCSNPGGRSHISWCKHNSKYCYRLSITIAYWNQLLQAVIKCDHLS